MNNKKKTLDIFQGFLIYSGYFKYQFYLALILNLPHVLFRHLHCYANVDRALPSIGYSSTF